MTSNRLPRVAALAGDGSEGGAALTAPARRLGVEPAAAPKEETAPPTTLRDPELRAEAALAKCEGLAAGRAASRRLIAAVEEGAPIERLRAEIAAAEAAASAPADEETERMMLRLGRAGFAEGAAQGLAAARARLARLRRASTRERALAALREVLADEIDARRQDGAAPEAAAGLLVERLGLRETLPITGVDLAGLGLAIAEEAADAGDAALSAALVDAAESLVETAANGPAEA